MTYKVADCPVDHVELVEGKIHCLDLLFRRLSDRALTLEMVNKIIHMEFYNK